MSKFETSLSKSPNKTSYVPSTPKDDRRLNSKETLLKSAIANDMNLLKKNKIKPMNNQKMSKSRDKIAIKKCSKTTMSTPKHVRSGRKTSLIKPNEQKQPFTYKAVDVPVEEKAIKYNIKDPEQNLPLTPNKAEPTKIIEELCDSDGELLLEPTPATTPSVSTKQITQHVGPLNCIKELTEDTISMMSNKKLNKADSKTSINKDISIMMDLCEKEASPEPVITPKMGGPGHRRKSSNKSGLKQTIDELNDFVMNILSNGKDSQLEIQANNYFTSNNMSKHADDNVLEVEYYDSNRTNSHASVSNIGCLKSNGVTSRRSSDAIRNRKQSYSSAFMELLTSEVIEESSNFPKIKKSDMFNMDMMSLSESNESGDGSWNIITDANKQTMLVSNRTLSSKNDMSDAMFSDRMGLKNFKTNLNHRKLS